MTDRNYAKTKRKINYGYGSVLVIREEAEGIAREVVSCIEDEELKGVVAGLLTREYYTNNILYRKHSERYGHAAKQRRNR